MPPYSQAVLRAVMVAGGWAAVEVHVCLTVPAPLFSPLFSVLL